MKKIFFLVKIIVFILIFHVLCFICALFFRDDAQSYTRALFKEFYNQDNIDVLFCGASHVSHGLYPKIMDEKLGVKTFCSGTPNQRIDGTYAIIQEAVDKYNVKEIWLEMDFAVAKASGNFKKEIPSKSTFLVANSLKNKERKFSYILNSTSPKYWINSFCPIGIDSLVDLNPIKAIKRLKIKIKRILIGDDFDIGNGHSYGGKGCVLDDDLVENGTYTSKGEFPINIQSIEGDFEKYVKLIMDFCKEKDVQLFFYCQPQSDFYLASKTNYDEYHKYIEKIIYPNKLIDFNYVKADVITFYEQDFYDDNHFNKTGVVKYTNFFCDYYSNGMKGDIFYNSFNEKLSLQTPKILGLIMTDIDKKKLKVTPILNTNDFSKVVVNADVNGVRKNFICNENGVFFIDYPAHSSGSIKLESFYDGVLNHNAKYNFIHLCNDR